MDELKFYSYLIMIKDLSVIKLIKMIDTNPWRASGGRMLTLYEINHRWLLQEKYGMVHQPL